MPILRRPAALAVACLVAVMLLGLAPGQAAALEPPRPLPGHRPAFVTETDVRPWTDCLWASAAMLLDKWTNGDVRVSHQRLRRLSGDLSGGSSLVDMRAAFRRLGVEVRLDADGDSTMTWRGLLARLRRGAGAVVLGDYSQLPRWYGRWDARFWRGRSKTDNHAVYVERYDAKRGRVWLMDPLGRGDWRGEWISTGALYRYAWFTGGRVQAIATPTAKPAPFAGVRLEHGRVGLSSTAITATWSLRAPRRWGFPGADATLHVVRAADPLAAAAGSAVAAPDRIHDPAPPRPIAGVSGHQLRVSAALPTQPGAYTVALAVSDRRFGGRVAATDTVAAFVPGPRRAQIRLQDADRRPEAGSVVRLTLSVSNTGDAAWDDPGVADDEGRTGTARATRLTATWIRLDDGTTGRRQTALDLGRMPLEPGASHRLQAAIRVPGAPGRWALVVDLVDDVDGSFAGHGSAPGVALFDVAPATVADGDEVAVD